jgi:hypothetical protein
VQWQRALRAIRSLVGLAEGCRGFSSLLALVGSELLHDLMDRDSHILQLHQDALITRSLVVPDKTRDGVKHLLVWAITQGSEGRA